MTTYNRVPLNIKTPSNTKYSIDTNGVIYNDTNGTIPKGRIKGGYHLICVCSIWKPIHRYVATAFCGNPDSKPYVNHIDGNKQNNAASNLEWCTHLENMQHAVRTGLWKPHIGIAHGRCMVTEEEVHRLCKRIACGKGYSKKVFPEHITNDMFYNIKRRKTWTHISEGYTW
jgi:hypothetical protein